MNHPLVLECEHRFRVHFLPSWFLIRPTITAERLASHHPSMADNTSLNRHPERHLPFNCRLFTNQRVNPSPKPRNQSPSRLELYFRRHRTYPPFCYCTRTTLYLLACSTLQYVIHTDELPYSSPLKIHSFPSLTIVNQSSFSEDRFSGTKTPPRSCALAAWVCNCVVTRFLLSNHH